MSDDEDDYMSDKFLSGEVRPSLIQETNKKRQMAIEERKRENTKRQKQESLARSGNLDNERLQESLKRPIEQQNKGFQMLAKMGYKPGQALGKELTSTSNSVAKKRLTEPIGISIKVDRGGLGHETALRDLAECRRKLREEQLRKRLTNSAEVVSVEEFRKRAQQKADERFAVGALKRCQLSCETLDTESGFEEAVVSWFWPERNEMLAEDVEESANEAKELTVNDEKDGTFEEDEEEYTPTQKLEMLTGYLRTSYKFCFWCGIRYKDEDDILSNCPGETKDDH